MKGLAPALIQNALDELDEEEKHDAAAALAAKLLRRYAGEEDERKAMHKVLAAMARRGYGYEDSRAAIETAIADMQDE